MATAGAEDLSITVENQKEETSLNDKSTVPSETSQDATSKDPPTTIGELGSPSAARGHNGSDAPNVHYPQPQTIFFSGYGNTGDWEEYSHYLTPDLLDLGSPGIYNENQSLLFPGYGYNVQMPFGPFSPVSPSPPARDGQMYTTPQYSFTAEHQGVFHSDTSNTNGLVFGHKPNFPSYGSYGRNAYSGNSGNPGFYDSRQGFEAFGFGGVWSDWMKTADGHRSWAPLSPAPLAGAFGQNVNPFSSGQASPQQRSLHGYGSIPSSYGRKNLHGGTYNPGGNYGSNYRNDRGWISIDKSRWQPKDAALCSCNGATDFLGEQNRGPRSTRQKNSSGDETLSIDGNIVSQAAVLGQKLYNSPDFITDYKDAKFFIIKSYSEDNIHKSIKYGVWTSTPNGNRKLDAAFLESKEKTDPCPVFLFFSVNASAQFCGVAEMVGPVDFEKSVDYWQQNKWCGHFPVKWHIVKDIPNSVLRHIILENNDNKPVTNSRDTQEVKLEQGLEMLSIFKMHESDMSILDDFEFYETRQKAMQERKAWRQQNQPHSTPFQMAGVPDQHHPAPLNVNFVNQMTKTFAQVVQLDEKRKEDGATTDTISTGPGELPNPSSTLST